MPLALVPVAGPAVTRTRLTDSPNLVDEMRRLDFSDYAPGIKRNLLVLFSIVSALLRDAPMHGVHARNAWAFIEVEAIPAEMRYQAMPWDENKVVEVLEAAKLAYGSDAELWGAAAVALSGNLSNEEVTAPVARCVGRFRGLIDKLRQHAAKPLDDDSQPLEKILADSETGDETYALAAGGLAELLAQLELLPKAIPLAFRIAEIVVEKASGLGFQLVPNINVSMINPLKVSQLEISEQSFPMAVWLIADFGMAYPLIFQKARGVYMGIVTPIEEQALQEIKLLVESHFTMLARVAGTSMR